MWGINAHIYLKGEWFLIWLVCDRFRYRSYLVWLLAKRICLPHEYPKAPHITFGWEFEVVYTLRSVPFHWPLPMTLSLVKQRNNISGVSYWLFIYLYTQSTGSRHSPVCYSDICWHYVLHIRNKLHRGLGSSSFHTTKVLWKKQAHRKLVLLVQPMNRLLLFVAFSSFLMYFSKIRLEDPNWCYISVVVLGD